MFIRKYVLMSPLPPNKISRKRVFFWYRWYRGYPMGTRGYPGGTWGTPGLPGVTRGPRDYPGEPPGGTRGTQGLPGGTPEVPGDTIPPKKKKK